jgi:virulence factor Mce-like protein
MIRARIAGTSMLVGALVASLTGCAVSVADLPLPATGVGGDSYHLSAVFADALNLPGGAHVKLNGDDIGRVQDITTRDFAAHVEMAVRKDVVLPVGTTAELRQDTPLGEVFVALHPSAAPAAGARTLHDGDENGLADTETAASVEQLLAVLSTVVNGGGLSQVQTISHELNAATAGRAPQISHLLDQTTRMVTTLEGQTANFDRLLAASDRLTILLHARSGSIDAAFDDLSPGVRSLADQTDRLTRAAVAAGDVSDTAGDLIHRSGDDIRSLLHDLGPLLDGFADTRKVLGPTLRDIVALAKVLEAVTKGEVVVGRGTISLGAPFAAPQRIPGPNDFANGSQSFSEHLEHQLTTMPGASAVPGSAVPGTSRSGTGGR